jgi:hypothetical protein
VYWRRRRSAARRGADSRPAARARQAGTDSTAGSNRSATASAVDANQSSSRKSCVTSVPGSGNSALRRSTFGSATDYFIPRTRLRFARQAALLRTPRPSARTGSLLRPAEGPPTGFGDAGHAGTPSSAGRPAAPAVMAFRASIALPQDHSGNARPLTRWQPFRFPKRAREDGRCLARTGDLLLVRREHVLQATAVCHSGRSANDLPHAAAALCCGLSLPERFQMLAALWRKSAGEPQEHASYEAVASGWRWRGLLPRSSSLRAQATGAWDGLTRPECCSPVPHP